MNLLIYLLLLTQILSYKQHLHISLPSLLEVFPEIKNIWPIWITKKGVRIDCKKDEDCLFPQACCPHPIIPGINYCCKGGYKQREMKYAFIYQQITN